MKLAIFGAAACALLATPLLASGDAAKGEADFKKCKACHAIVADDGTEIQKGGKTGPNLYGVIGRAAGSVADFKYSEGLAAAGAAGLVWDEALVAEYLADPTAFIDSHGGSGKSKMTFKLPKGGEDMAAYLASVAAQ